MIVYYYRNPGQLSEELLAELANSLPQQQQQILSKMKNHRHRCEQVVAYFMLCDAIANNDAEIKGNETIVKDYQNKGFEKQCSEPPLWTFGEHGKPSLANYEGIHFNISHCNEAVAIAVSDKEVGIDVEGRRKFSETLLQRSFDEKEQASVLRSNDPESEFARIWTRKEAWFKWTGTGILMDHLKTTETEAQAANCNITTTWVNDSFWLSIAESVDCSGLSEF